MTFNSYIQFAIALLFVLALMGLLTLIIKKVNQAQSGLMGKKNRLKIVEQRLIDSKHKIAIIRCDDTEHLVVISQNSSNIIETNIKTPIINTPHKKDIPVESF